MKILSALFTKKSIPTWIIISCFGPYILMQYGIRTDHILIYVLAMFAFLIFCVSGKELKVKKKDIIYKILMLLILATIWTLCSTFIGDKNYNLFAKVLSHFEHYLQAIAIILIFYAFVNTIDKSKLEDAFIMASYCLILLLFINSIISILWIFDIVSREPITDIFVKVGEGAIVSVSELGQNMGRYSGIFNQPFEAGVMYSIGLIAWSYLYSHESCKIGYFLIIILLVMLLGGMLTVSKAFLFVGIPLLLFYFIWVKKYSLFKIRHWFVFIALSSFFYNKLIEAWSAMSEVGVDLFLNYFRISEVITSEEKTMMFYTASRYGDEESVSSLLFNAIWSKSPIRGLGFGSVTVMDSGHLEFFVQGGLVGLTIYIFILVIIGSYSFKALKHNRNIHSALCFSLFIILLINGLGAPILTLSRVGPVFLIFLLMAIAMCSQENSVEDANSKDYLSRRSNEQKMVHQKH